MIRRSFGRMSWPISAIGLGSWNIGNQWGEVDDATAFATVRAAVEAGVNLIDTADTYGTPLGTSEQRVGSSLAGIRQTVYVLTKVGRFGWRTGQLVPCTTPDVIRLCVHASLHRLRSDWVDILLCHIQDLEDPSVFLEAFEQLKRSGEIRAYGISTNSLEVLRRFDRDGTCDVVEVDYSLLDRAPEHEFLPYCAERGIAVVVRGALGRGLLSGRYSADSVFTDSVRCSWNAGGHMRKEFEEEVEMVDAIRRAMRGGDDMSTTAIRFVLTHQTAPVAVIGARSPEQARANARAGDALLTEEQMARFSTPALASFDSPIRRVSDEPPPEAALPKGVSPVRGMASPR